jgi:CheY-like chemotaxis protein
MSVRKKSILVVDDSEDVREYCELLLSGAGYNVRVAADGEQALERVREARPDVIVTDVVMPGLDGFGLLVRLKSDLAPPVPPVIVCSGFDITEEEALRRGALVYLPKPVTSEQLLECIKLALAGRTPNTQFVADQHQRTLAARRIATQAGEAALAGIDLDALRPKALIGCEWVRSYFGFRTSTLLAVTHGKLEELASAGQHIDPNGLLPHLSSIVSTGSSLVVSDVTAHPSFSRASWCADARFFAGVPICAPNGSAFGALCIADSEPRTFVAEDLLLLEHLGRKGSETIKQMVSRTGLFSFWSTPGVFSRQTFETLLGIELELLRREGGAIELAVVEVDANELSKSDIWLIERGRRLAMGAFGASLFAFYNRGRDERVVAARVTALLKRLEFVASPRAIGAAALIGNSIPSVTGHELVALAFDALANAGRGELGTIERFVLRREPYASAAQQADGA